MKFRKRPIVIEAVQWKHGYFQFSEDVIWLTEAIAGSKTIFRREGDMFIKTLEGEMKVSVGDYIIRGVDGELYPCKPHIFEKTYEAVED